MTEYFTTCSAAREAAAVDRGQVPNVHHEGLVCASYAPGHHLHLIHWRKVRDTPPRVVRRVKVDGFHVELGLEVGDADDDILRWHHHDPERLSKVLETVPGRVLAYPELHALSVGTLWFNCATPSTGWRPCRELPTP